MTTQARTGVEPSVLSAGGRGFKGLNLAVVADWLSVIDNRFFSDKMLTMDSVKKKIRNTHSR